MKKRALIAPLIFLALFAGKGNCNGKKEITIKISTGELVTTRNKVIVHAVGIIEINNAVWPKLQILMANAYNAKLFGEDINDAFIRIDRNVVEATELLVDAVDLYLVAKSNGDELKAQNILNLISGYSTQLVGLLKQGIAIAKLNGVRIPANFQ